MSKGNRKKKRRRQQAAARAAAQKKHAQAAAKPSEPEQGLAENSFSTLERDIEPVEQSVKSQESEAKAEASSKDASVEPVEEQAVDETDPESRQENMVQSEEKDCEWDRFPFGEEDEDESAENRDGEENFAQNVPFPVSWTVKMKKKQKETQDILSYHTQAAGCSDKARAKASGGRQPIEECGRTGL